ncbi:MULTISPECIES: hypothetical protein [Streptomyces]|uniref:Uncharacterized protein n=2 Tax=Streptomyces TaxID=1883 RepID=A0ABV9ITZ4_9ACTN
MIHEQEVSRAYLAAFLALAKLEELGEKPLRALSTRGWGQTGFKGASGRVYRDSDNRWHAESLKADGAPFKSGDKVELQSGDDHWRLGVVTGVWPSGGLAEPWTVVVGTRGRDQVLLCGPDGESDYLRKAQ